MYKARSIVLTCLFLVSFAAFLHVNYQLHNGDKLAALLRDMQLEASSTGGGGRRCELPRLDPWDASIAAYVEREPRAVECKRLQAELTYLDERRFLRINASEAARAGYYGNGTADRELLCQYRCFDRAAGVDDVTLRYGRWIQFAEPVKVHCEFVEVRCYKGAWSPAPVYTNLHNQIVAMNNVPEHRDPTNILMFTLDSVSRSNFIRQMPKTLSVLKTLYNATVMEGFIKVGDNSLPNAVAMLTGKRIQTVGHASELQDDMSQTFYDRWPFVWNDYKAAGYTTMYAEDLPPYNLFKYLALGFKDKPVDHYFRPYWLRLFGSLLHQRSTHLCYGNALSHTLQLNYLRQFFTKYDSSVPKFAFSWLTELGHDWLNQLSAGDDSIATMFAELAPHVHDNTWLLLMGDHGHRFDAIRESVVGRLEERLPVFVIAPPAKLARRYGGGLGDVLRANAQVPTSFFDIYVTLKDILNSSTSGHWEFGRQRNWHAWANRGQSLLRPLARNRSCTDAGVPAEFCVCQREFDVPATDSVVQLCADALVAHINELLRSGGGGLCAPLSLSSIKHAQLLAPPEAAVDAQSAVRMLTAVSSNQPTLKGRAIEIGSRLFNGNSMAPARTGIQLTYRLTVATMPGGGVFEGTVRRDMDTSGRLLVTGDVDRINRYGNQSLCVHTAHMRKLCYCKTPVGTDIGV